ncbi:unnamed protein product [Pylaiella littoralis]
MASRVMFLLGLVLGFPAASRASTTSTALLSDPSCVTVEIAAAATFKSEPDCPAVLVSVSLDASTENCASDVEVQIVIEENPRDVKTFGGEGSYANLLDDAITWVVPSLTNGTAQSLEFRVDFCDYCDKYDGGRFNPVDSFKYNDLEGNEPNDRESVFKLKLDCTGIDGDPVTSIVATPAPVLLATPTPSTMGTTSPATASTEAATSAPSRLSTSSPSATSPATASTEAATSAPSRPATSSLSTAPTAAPATTATMAPVSSYPVEPIASTSAPVVPATPSPSTTGTTPPASASPVVASPAPSRPVTSSPSTAPTTSPVTLSPAESIASTTAPVVPATPSPSTTGTTPPASASPVVASPAPSRPVTSSPSTAPTTLPVTLSPAESIASTTAPVFPATPSPSTTGTTPPASASPVVASPAPSRPVTSSPSTAPTTLPVTLSSAESIASTTAPVFPATPPPSTTGTTPPASASPVVASPAPSRPVTSSPSTAPTTLPVTSSPAESIASTTAPFFPATPPPSTTGTTPPASASPVVASPAPSRPVTSSPSTAPTTLPVTSSPAESIASTTAPFFPATPPPSTTGTTPPASASPVVATSAPSRPVTSSPSTAPTTSSATIASAVPVTTSPVESIATTTAPVFPATPSPSTTGTTPPVAASPVVATSAPSRPATSAPSTRSATSSPSTTSTTGRGTTATTAPATSSPAESITSTTVPVFAATPPPSTTGTTSPVAASPVVATSVPSEAQKSSSNSSSIGDGDGSGISSEEVLPDEQNDSTGAPTTAGTDGTREFFFTTSPTGAPTAPTTAGTDGSSPGISLEIQSVFEARRRALASDVSDPALERRALAGVYWEDADEYNDAMTDVCASMLGVGRESVISVSTDFGPERTTDGAARRILSTASSSSGDGGSTATQLTPVTTCEVDVSGGGSTRAVTAAGLVDRMLQPGNFILMLDENRFGPVNAVLSSISFWQNECRDQTCPAGDGSYASVFAFDSEPQGAVAAEGGSEEERRELWFFGIAGGLLVLALLSWCAFFLCCGGCQKQRNRKRRLTAEDRYTVRTPPEEDAAVAALSPRKARSSTVVTKAFTPDGSEPPPSPPTPPTGWKTNGERRIPPRQLSTAQRMMSPGGKAAPAEPLSPGEADWRGMFGLGPLRDYAFRSAPVSPRKCTPSTDSVGSTKRSPVDAFCTTYQDHVVSAADGRVGGKMVLPPPLDDESAAMESQWHVSDEVSASIQHTNDPVVRYSLDKAGRAISKALTSPRRELNRLKAALNRPAKLQHFPSTSPTVAASSAGQSPRRGFGFSEGCPSPQNNSGRGGSGRGVHFNETLHEIDLEAEGNVGAATDDEVSVDEPVMSSPSRSRASGRNMFAKSPGSTSTSRSSSLRAGAPTGPSDGSTSPGRFDHAGAGNAVAAAGGGRSSVLTLAAALAEVKVGVQSPTGRAALAFAEGGSGDGGGGGGAVAAANVSGGSGDGPPSVSPVALSGDMDVETRPGNVQDEGIAFLASPRGDPTARCGSPPSSPFSCLSPPISPRAVSRLPEIDDEEDTDVVTEDVNDTGFSRHAAPQIFPRAVSRLPEIDDEEDMDAVTEDASGVGKGGPESPPPSLHSPHSPRGGGAGIKSAGRREAPGAPVMSSLERVVANPRSLTLAPDLTPIAELAEKECFSDSETESEISSRASSVGSARGGRRVSRDPAALLAAAIEKAGQIAAIPPPSAGSPGQIGRPLSAVQELPMEAIPLHGLSDTPERTGSSTPRREGGEGDTPERTGSSTPRQEGGGGFCRDGGSTTGSTPPKTRAQVSAPVRTLEATEVEALAPIPSPAQRPPDDEAREKVALPSSLVATGDKSVVGNPLVAAPRSRQEEEDEEKEHKAWEIAEKEKEALGVVDRVALASDSSSATPVGPSELASSARSPDATAAAAAQIAPAKTKGVEPLGFSLKSALTCFLERQSIESAAPAVFEAEEADPSNARKVDELAAPVVLEEKVGPVDPAEPDCELAAPVVPGQEGEEEADPRSAREDDEHAAPLVLEEEEADPADPVDSAEQDCELSAPVVPEQEVEEEADPSSSARQDDEDDELTAPLVLEEVEVDPADAAEQDSELAAPVVLGKEEVDPADPAEQDSELTAPCDSEQEGEEGADPTARQDDEVAAPLVLKEEDADTAVQDCELSALVVPEQEEEEEEEEEAGPTTVPGDIWEKPVPGDFCKSPEAHTLDAWPDAIVEKQPKTSLDDGFMDVTIPEVAPALEEQGPDTGDDPVFKLPARVSPVHLPVIVLPAAGDVDEPSSTPGQSMFSRATMNEQSPAPDSLKAPVPAPMHEPTKPYAYSLQSPSISTVTNPSRIVAASPMYDRAEIARAMSRAEHEADDDGDSDVMTPNGSWPSERRINSYTGSTASDITSSSSGSGSGSSYHTATSK